MPRGFENDSAAEEGRAIPVATDFSSVVDNSDDFDSDSGYNSMQGSPDRTMILEKKVRILVKPNPAGSQGFRA